MPLRLVPAIVVALIFAGLILFSFNFLDLIILMGHHIPSEDLSTDYLTAVVIAMAL